MVVAQTKVSSDHFNSIQTSNKVKLSPNVVLSSDKDITRMVRINISDKSRKESYLEELGKIIKHKSNKPIKIIEH